MEQDEIKQLEPNTQQQILPWAKAASLKVIDFFLQLDIKIAIKTAAAAFLSLYMSNQLSDLVHRPSYLIANLWSVITAIVVLQASIGGTYKAVWLRFIGVVIGSAVGAFFAFEFGAGVASIGGAILATLIICSLFKINDTYRLMAMSVVVIMLPWKANTDDSPWVYAFFRFFDTCLGFIAALVVAHFLWPTRALSKVHGNMAERFRYFADFLDTLFQKGSQENIVLKKLQDNIEASFNKGKTILDESKAELFTQPEALNGWISMMRCEEELWENLSLLRSISYSVVKEIFDESLSLNIHRTLSFIKITMEAIASTLANEETHLDYHSIGQAQQALNEELIRFRSTHRMRSYPLEVVENSFVFFYQLKKILIILEKFIPLLNEAKNISSRG